MVQYRDQHSVGPQAKTKKNEHENAGVAAWRWWSWNCSTRGWFSCVDTPKKMEPTNLKHHHHQKVVHRTQALQPEAPYPTQTWTTAMHAYGV